jgi:phosphoribosyl 1,2-cyclic phosphodiesterase
VKATVWGCRGSCATPGADTVRYGGNTSCVEVTLESGQRIVLDAGTGMRPLGVQINGDGRELHIMLTHLHLDHLQGLGFFRPLFDPGLEVHLWGPASPVQSLEERIAIYLSPPLFPVHLSDIPARLVFHDEPHHVTIGSATVHAANVTHQGPTVGYRIEEHGKVLAYPPTTNPRSAAISITNRRTGSAATRSRTTPTSCSTTPSTGTGSTRRMWGGATRASTMSTSSRASSTSPGSCCSITTRTTPTKSSKRCSTTRGSDGTTRATASASRTRA